MSFDFNACSPFYKLILSLTGLTVLAVLSIIPGVAAAQSEQSYFSITESSWRERLGKYMYILEDKTGDLTIEDVTAPAMTQKFVRSESEQPGFGFTRSVYWVRIEVENRQKTPVDWYLDVGYPLIDKIDLYVNDKMGSFVVKQFGDHLPFDARSLDYRIVIIPMNEAAESRRSYWLRFQSDSSMNMPMNFWRLEAFFESALREEILQGVFYGALIIMLIYNVLLFAVFRDLSYAYYVLFFVSWGLAQMSITGLAYQYLWSTQIWWANICIPFFIFLATLSIIYLGRSSLDTKFTIPSLDRFFHGLLILCPVGAVFSLIGDYPLSIRLASGFAMLTALAWIGVAGYLARLGQRPAQFFILALLLFFLGVILFGLKSFGVLPGNFITNWSPQLGGFAAMVLFSLATTDKIIRALKQSETLLEQEVQIRTSELEGEKKKSEDANLVKGKFLAYMSHEIRTPMNGILGMARLILDTRLDQDQKHLAKTIHVSGENLLRIVNDLLDVSKLEAEQLKIENYPFTIDQLSTPVLAIMEPLARKKGLVLTSKVDPQLPEVLTGDAHRLIQVLMNLVSNAIKFTEHGSISMSFNKISETEDSTQLQFSITDTGNGMSKDQRNKLFSPYIQGSVEVARLHGGTGLGLMICRQLIKLMGGEITVESTPGKGSRFMFDLSLQAAEEAKLDQFRQSEGEGEPEIPTSTLKLLQVEDNETNRELVELILGRYNHEVISVGNGVEALELLKRGENFDVIITDWHMPEMDGIELTRQIRNMILPHKTLPILGITASTIDSERQQCQDAGMNMVIAKPVDDRELLAALARLTRTKTLSTDIVVLVIDDVEINLELAQRQLNQIGVRSELCQSSVEALELARTRQYNLILCDISMPVMDGVEFTKQLRLWEQNSHTRIPVIAVTGNASHENYRSYMDAGLDDCLEKPVVISALESILLRWVKIHDNSDCSDDHVVVDSMKPEYPPPPIDEQLLADILGSNDPKMRDDMLKLFTQHFSGMLHELKAAIETEDGEAIREAAHAAKSAAGSTAAMGLKKLLEKLEHETNNSDSQQINAFFENISTEYQRVISFCSTTTENPGNGQ